MKWIDFCIRTRPILDTSLLSSIGIIISVNSDNYSNLEKLIPVLAVIAVASQRILPILNQLYAGHMGNVDATPHTNFILNFLKNSKTTNFSKSKKSFNFKKIILLKDISFSYADDEQNLVLKNINLKIHFGSKIGIIGKSGSGKSTLGDIILGLLNPTSGKLTVDGKPILDKKNNWYKNVASFQNILQ